MERLSRKVQPHPVADGERCKRYPDKVAQDRNPDGDITVRRLIRITTFTA